MISLLFYALAILLATPDQLHWLAKLAFWVFSIYVFYYVNSICHPERSERPKKILPLLILIPLAILLITRIIPLIRWHKVVPFGADAAIYLKDFSPYFLYSSHLLFSAATLLGLYLLTKDYFGARPALASAFLFSVSVPQFLAYYAFYWKMLGAIPLFLFAFYLLSRQSWAAVPLAAIAGSLHLPSLLPFGLAMIGDFIFGKNRAFTLMAGLIILLAVVAITGPPFIEYSTYYTQKLGIASTEYLKGQYIDVESYKTMALIYLPFAILGLLKLIRKKRFNYLFFFLIVNLGLVIMGSVFHQRFLILLDITLIAAAGIILAKLPNKLWQLLLAAATVIIFYQSLIATPFITNPAEIEEIKNLAKTEPDSQVIAFSHLYRPFLIGFSQREVLLYNSNKGFDHQEPFYVFVGRQITPPSDLINNQNFKQISNNIWKKERSPLAY